MTELVTAYAHGPGRWIEPGPPPTYVPEPGTRRPLTDLAAQGPFAAAVARLLIEVLTPIRWEPWNSYNDHRAYPSPRAAYLVDVVLVAGGARLPLDPVRRALVGTDLPALDGHARLEFRLHPERLSSGYGEFAAALADLEAGHVAGALAENAARVGLRATADRTGVTLRPGNHCTPSVLPPRSAGLGPMGLSADPRPLPESDLAAVIAAITDRPLGTLSHSGLSHRFAVHNVTGRPDGWYDGTGLCRAGDAMADVQAAYGHPRSAIDVAGMNLVVVLSADLPAYGTYRDLLRAAGACAQHVCTAAASVGLFCRPVRSVDDQRLEAAAGLPLSHSVLYLLLAGRPKVGCFPYDLTPLEPL